VTVKIAPSLLAADFGCLREEALRAQAGGADWLHVDVMDGRFVPNLTLGPAAVAALRGRVTIPLDVHLMVEDPLPLVPAFARAGATLVTVHAEACRHLHGTLQQVREAGVRAGVALNPATPLQAVEHVLHLVELVLLMTVNPGFGGQAFLPEVLPKVEALRRRLGPPGPGVPEIEVDGGITPETAGRAAGAGATVLVAGSAVFGSPDPARAIAELRAAAAQATRSPG